VTLDSLCRPEAGNHDLPSQRRTCESHTQCAVQRPAHKALLRRFNKIENRSLRCNPGKSVIAVRRAGCPHPAGIWIAQRSRSACEGVSGMISSWATPRRCGFADAPASPPCRLPPARPAPRS